MNKIITILMVIILVSTLSACESKEKNKEIFILYEPSDDSDIDVNAIRNIDERILKIMEHREYLSKKENNDYVDFYDDVGIVYREFYCKFEIDSGTGFDLYYDEVL